MQDVHDEHELRWRGRTRWRVEYTFAILTGIVMLVLFGLGVWKACEVVAGN